MRRIFVVSHCILNTASKVECDERELAEELAQRARFLRLVLDKDVDLLQLPCPEFILYGSRRWGHVREQFEHPHYRQAVRAMLEPILLQVEEYLSNPERFQLLGFVSVEGSPSCGYHLTCRGDWGGEFGNEAELARRRATLRMVEEPGAMMHILAEELKRRSWSLPILTMPEAIDVLVNS